MILPGYTITGEIHRTGHSALWRARRAADGREVLIKAPLAEFPEPHQLDALRREHELLTRLTIDGIIRPIELLAWRDRLALVLEAAGDTTLKRELASGPLSPSRCICLGQALAGILCALHRRGIIHGSLSAHHILRRTGSGTVTVVPDEGREGSIGYLSPEQTGRMNRDVDYRTDFYSLGVILYEAATGALPFESADPLEVVHAHLARQPVTPGERNSRVPEAFSRLILRLLAKAPEERYQSARGIACDLALIATAGDAASSQVVLGTEDVPERLMVSPQLYGRADERAQLRAAFERAAAGSGELVLVSGYSGVGKTSLVQELCASLPRAQGRLISGKFDQLARDIPYRAMSQALRGLVVQLLAEPDAAVEAVTADLRQALGRNAQVMVDLVPELERLIGAQPPAPVLGATEAHARFGRLFQALIRSVVTPSRPLILFLDDLQWADAGSLSLLPLLLEREAIPGLLVVGAYRNNEVTPTHALRLALTELAQRGIRCTEVELPPLSEAQVRALVNDSLPMIASEADPMAELVHRKTAGNPFFVKQLLQTMWHDGVMAFDGQLGRWTVNLAAAADLAATDNVLMLMASRIGRLEPPVQRILQYAACIGNRFDLSGLATISGDDESAVAPLLLAAEEAGLILSDHGAFHFLHDRVQQAAYALIAPENRTRVHLAIGRRLLTQWKRQPDELPFEVVNHLNYAVELIDRGDERLELAGLNLVAGRRSKASAAYPSALSYFSAGVDLVRRCPGDHHDLAFALELELGEAEYLTGRMQEAESTLLGLLTACRTPVERAAVTDLLITEYETLSRYDDAIAIGVEGLRQLGIALPSDPESWEIELRQEVAAIQERLGARSIASLAELPVLDDVTLRHALRLLQATWTPCYVSGRSRLGDLLVARLVRLSIEHGNCEASAFGYLHHAITVGAYLGEYGRGAEFGELALTVNERFRDQRLRAVVYHRFAALIAPWRHSFAGCVGHAREAVVAATESGNLPVAGYAEFQQAWYGMHLDPSLEGFIRRHGPTVDLLDRLQIHSYADMQRILIQWAAALRGDTASPTSLDGGGFASDRFSATVGQGGIFRALHATVRLELLCTAGRFEQALALASADAPYVSAFIGSIWPAQFAFWHGMALAAGPGNGERLTQLRDIESRFAQWAASAPENFAHLHVLLRAERLRLEGTTGEAVTAYEAALEAATRTTSPRHRALVNERYAAFWLERGHTRVAHAFLAEARYGYAQWGAISKVRQLNERIGDAEGIDPGRREPVAPLDLSAVMKAAQAITREVHPDGLLERMIGIALETAGADHGVLLLERDALPVSRVVASPDGIELLPDPGVPLAHAPVPAGIVQLVRRSLDAVVIANAATDDRSAHDAYVLRERPRSILCAPILNQGRLLGVLYVENRLTADAFTAERVRVLQLLSVQAAIALVNAQLYEESTRHGMELRSALDEVRRLSDRLQTENILLQEQIDSAHGFEEIVGRSGVLRLALTAVEQVAPTDTTVLISGETGTGKELLARAIHRLSPRRDHALVTVNCGAVAPGLVESELFGHEKGAFTGALSRRLGRFEVADGGTLFLDEIGDLPLDLQVKLLRVLQEGEFERVGGSKPIRVNVRVIAATHRDLTAQVREGKFRADLYYRLNVFPIRAPALRERPEDIAELVRYFVLKYATKLGKRIDTISREVLDRLASYEWPGNIRELANIIERSVILTRGTSLQLDGQLGSVVLGAPRPRAAEEERRRIVEALEQTGWRVSGPRGAALLLGLKPTTLEARMKRLGLGRPAAMGRHERRTETIRP